MSQYSTVSSEIEVEPFFTSGFDSNGLNLRRLSLTTSSEYGIDISQYLDFDGPSIHEGIPPEKIRPEETDNHSLTAEDALISSQS